jgi:alkylation response protein AidB-like acyl-CoA dehydrogenase
LNFDYTPKVQDLRKQVTAFMNEHVYPNEHGWHEHVKSEKRWEIVPIIEELKPKAKAAGLWNLWRPKSHGGTLTNLEYAPLCEIMGRVTWAPEIFNCSAPDTGNMETILKYGTPEHVKQWCEPLLEGKIRSAFLMTEPDVASSDATNIQTRMPREERLRHQRHKWWSSGAGDPRCKIYIVMGKTDPDNASRHSQQSMVLVPADQGNQGPAPSAGVRLRRRAARPHGDRAEGRARADRERAARRGPRLRDRAGTPRTRAHPPLHAPHRPGGARAGEDVQARHRARRFRPPVPIRA